jgi:hypothetical protein
MKRERDPTPEEFAEFLAWLDPDPEEAGRKFNLIQSRLTRIFVCRGCIDAESLADEVINRVAVRIKAVKATYDNPIRCCIGFTTNVYREYLKYLKEINSAKPPPPPRPPEELEKEDACLRRCIEKLANAQRDLVVRYFQAENRIKNRKRLAEELRLTANALRIQAHHLRKKVRLCLEVCLAEI